MNKDKDLLLTFFLAPLTTFFLPRVYQSAAVASWRKGILFIVYGALVLTALVMAVFLERGSTSDKFIHWIKEKTPVVIWTPKGLSLENGEKKATLVHPVYGPIVTFDMDRENVTEDDVGELFLFVTSKKIVFRKVLRELEDRDVTKMTPQNQQPTHSELRVTGEFIENFYKKMKAIVLALTPVVVFPMALIVFLFICGFFTIAGLLLNEMRGRKLNSGGVFNLACFSSGTSLAVTSLILLGFYFSRPLPALLLPIGLLVSLLYMIAAVIFVPKQDLPLSQKALFLSPEK